MMMIKVMVIRMILVADGDLLSMMLAMNYFGLILFLSDNKKYLHNIVLDLFPFASDTSVWHNPTVMLHSSITSLL